MLNIIDSAYELIHMLSTPIETYIKTKHSIHRLWIKYNIELFNSQSEFLSMGKLSFVKDNLFLKSFMENYKAFKSSIHFAKGNNKVFTQKNNCYVNLEKSILECYDISEYVPLTDAMIKKLVKVKQNINRCIKFETNYYDSNKPINTLLVTFVYQYLNEFENKSININMWNYSLRSLNVSKKYLYLGIITVFSQISWLSILLYNIITDWDPNYDSLILVVAILSSLISVLYSFDTVHSFYNSYIFYKFTYILYSDFPKLNGNKFMLKWNFIADSISNCVIPILMPFINFFIVLHSNSVLESILNSMAIFFIIHIDEELYTRTTYENETDMKLYVKKVISTLYNYYTPTFSPNFTYEYETGHAKLMKLAYEQDS